MLLITMLAVALLGSACSQSINIGSGNAVSSYTPLQVLQKSADAMKQLKSSHVNLQSTNNVQTIGGSATPTSNAQSPTSYNITIKGDGDQALPDEEQLNLNINEGTKIVQILKGNQVYIQNPQGKWYVISKSQIRDTVGNPFSGVNLDQNSLLGLIQHTKITDHGYDSPSGVTVPANEHWRHITAALDKEALRQLLTDNPQLKSSLGQQNIDTLLNNTKSFTSTVDVWIDETQFYVHRTQFVLNMDATTSGLANGAPNEVSTKINSIVDLSKFNETVNITAPTNATPASDAGTIFSFWNAHP